MKLDRVRCGAMGERKAEAQEARDSSWAEVVS